jgi:molybdenum cofactor cytidylyltransferase
VIPAIVLAAGRSSRMGRAKAMLPAGAGETVLSRIVRTLRDGGAADVVVVVGHDGHAIACSAAEHGIDARVVLNEHYDRGQWSSLVVGLNAIDRPGIAAALVTLVDVPLVSAATVRAVIARYHEVHAPVVRPSRGSEHGHPLLIDRSLFDAIRHADPERGAKPVVRAHASPAGDLPIDDAGAFTDLDTPEDYERWIAGRHVANAGAPETPFPTE